MSIMNKKLKLVLPLPPSNNEYLYPKRIGRNVRLAETTTSKKWKNKVTPIIKREIKKQNWDTVPRGTFLNVHIDYFFNRKGSDPNNYLKILYDVMENCGVYENDDMCKPQTGIVIIDKYNPRIEITIEFDRQTGVFRNDVQRTNFISDNEFDFTNRKFKSILKNLDDNRLTEEVYFKNNELFVKKDENEHERKR